MSKQMPHVKQLDMKPLVLSYDNQPTDTTRTYIDTLTHHGWDYTMLGEGEQWRGFISKMDAYARHLRTLDDAQVVVLTDARDVFCVRQSSAFLEAFRSFTCGIVVSMELFCGGHLDVADDYKHVQCVPLTPYWNHWGKKPVRKFVNSGLIAGTVSALNHMYQWIMARNFHDDQYALGSYMNAFPERVYADSNADLLHTSTFGVNAGMQALHIQKQDSPTFAELFGRGAFFLHIPGMANKGQRCVYESVHTLVRAGICGRHLTEPYGWQEPSWNERF
jgi:hypothetical protein